MANWDDIINKQDHYGESKAFVLCTKCGMKKERGGDGGEETRDKSTYR